MSYQFLKFKLCYALFFVYNIKDIFRLLYPGNVSSCLKAMPSVVIIWNLLLKTQPAAAHSYYFQSVILARFVSSNFDSKSRTVNSLFTLYVLLHLTKKTPPVQTLIHASPSQMEMFPSFTISDKYSDSVALSIPVIL